MEQRQPIAILAVDDEPGVLALILRCLNDKRVTLSEASSGKDAQEQIAKAPGLDLLITDVLLAKPFTRKGLREAVALLLFGRTTL